MSPKSNPILKPIKDAVKCVLCPVWGCFLVGILAWDIIVTRPRRKKKRAQALKDATAIPFAGAEGSRRPVTPRSYALKPRSRKQRRYIQAQSQPQSLLVSLPPELRTMIWYLCLGGNQLSIRGVLDTPMTGSQLDVTWPNPKLEVEVHPPECTTMARLCCGPECKTTRPKSLLPLLLTCRQVYTECISVLYTKNMFAIHNSTGYWKPVWVWPHGRFDLLTRLEATFLLQEFQRSNEDELHAKDLEWVQSWRTIGSLPNLRHLTVYLEHDQVAFWPDGGRLYGTWEDHILEEPRKITRPETWILYINWESSDERIEKRKDYPFKIRRCEAVDRRVEYMASS